MRSGSSNTTTRALPVDGAALLKPTRLAESLGARPPDGLARGLGVAFDSRRVRPGDVFFALPGAAGHGIEHAAEALSRGAAYVVSDRPPRAETDRLLLVDDALAAMKTLGGAARAAISAPVVAVTGSAGKTTTKTLVTAALAGRSTPGNLNTIPALVAALVEGALMDALLEPLVDTPLDAAANGFNRGALVGEGGPGSAIVLELGIDRPGEMAELISFCRPDHGLITTIGESHLAALGDVESVAREKAKLLTSAPGVRLASTGAVARLPEEVAATTFAVEAQLLPGGSLSFRGHDFALPWAGIAMAENVALALELALSLGVEPEIAYARMVASRLEPGRLQRVDLGDLLLIDDSYNSNPLSVALALEVLRAAPAPHVAILGDMRELGPVSRQRHRDLGRATTDLDLVIAVGEEAAAMVEANPAVVTTPDAAGAIELLARIPQGATVLVKGSRSLGLERVVAAIKDRR